MKRIFQLFFIIFLICMSYTSAGAVQKPKNGFTLTVGRKIEASVKTETSKATISVNVIKALITKDISGSISSSLNFDVDAMAGSIYNELEQKYGIVYRDNESLESKVYDSITERVGLSGLNKFADESNAILDSEWNVIYNGLGIQQPKPEGYNADVKLYFNVLRYDSYSPINIKLTFSAKNNFMALDGSYAPVKYKIVVQKDGDWLSTYEYDYTTDKPEHSENISLLSPGRYYVTAVKTDVFDWISVLKWKCTVIQQ